MPAERTLTELATDVAYQAGDLIRNEIRLARAEAMENVREIGDGLLRAAFGVAFAGSAVTLESRLSTALTSLVTCGARSEVLMLIGAGEPVDSTPLEFAV